MDDLHYKPLGDCVFIHIPKTAGISIYESVLDLERPFGWFFGLNKKYLNDLLKDSKKLKSMKQRPDKIRGMLKESYVRHWPIKGASMLGHIHYQSLILDNKLDKEYFDGSFKFAFVRNPYDRLVSLYKYHRIEKQIGLDFDTFVKVLSLDFKSGRVPPVGLYNIKPFPQTSKLHNLNIYGNQYNPMVDWLPPNFSQNVLICYLETFEQDIDKLLSMVGFEGTRNAVPKKNKSKYQDNFMDFYKKRETIDIVNDIYKKDFDAFGYDII